MSVREGKNYLGIDWGASKVGVALAHGETRIALGYAALRNDEALFGHLGSIIKEEDIGTVVIGIPRHALRDGDQYEGEAFGRALAEAFPVKVAYQDEMFTTKMAQANLIERGASGISKDDDREAARIILSEWLSASE